MWKILIGLDIAFSSLAIVAAGVLGNGLLADHIPRLHANSTWLSRLVMTGLTGPDALADWALGALPTASILLFFTVLVAAESLLILLTPLVERALVLGSAHKYQEDSPSIYHEVLRKRGQISLLKRRFLRRVILRLSAMSFLAFTVGLAASAIAWGVALLINVSTGGVIQTFTIVLSIAALLLIYNVLSEVVPSVVEDDNDGLSGFGELFQASGLPLRRKVQRPWQAVAVVVIIVGSIVLVSRLAQRHQETSVHENDVSTQVAQLKTENTPAGTTKLEESRWAVASLGSFSDGDSVYQLELWRDHSSRGQVLGLISVFPEDVSKLPRVGELGAIKGNGTNGNLSFSSKLLGEEISFEGIAQGNTLEGTFRSSRVRQPWHMIFRRLGRRYDENYESKRQWSMHIKELLACCGPGANPG